MIQGVGFNGLNQAQKNIDNNMEYGVKGLCTGLVCRAVKAAL